jgi:cytochrome c biogenesis protein CcdA
MALLLLFALIAGAGTALSPCVLPILPALLSAGATGGRRRPFGIVLGLAITFTITIVGLAEVVDGVGLGDGSLRSLAVVVLLGFGVLLLVPRLADRSEALAVAADPSRPEEPGRRLPQRHRGRRRARLRLRAVRRADPRGGHLGQRRIRTRLWRWRSRTPSGRRPRCSRSASSAAACSIASAGPWLQRVMGIVMVVTALAIATDATSRSRTRSPTTCRASAGQSDGGHRALHHSRERARRPARRGEVRGERRRPARARRGARVRRRDALAELQAAHAREPARPRRADRLLDLHVHQLHAHAAARQAWDARYRDRGLTIVGVHTPEFASRRTRATSRTRSPQRHRYPVAQDNDYGTWDAGATSTGRRST